MNKVFGFVAEFFDKRIYVFAVLFCLLFLFDFVAIQYSLYFHYKWIDIPAHFLGGFFLSALFFYIVFSNPRSKKLLKISRTPEHVFWVTVLFVGVTAVGWEVIEFLAGRTSISPAYFPDTTLDIIAGMVGGYTFYLLYKKIREMVRAEFLDR